MFAETMTAVDSDLHRDRVSGLQVVGLLMAIMSIVAVAGWTWRTHPDPATWLPADRPGAVNMHRGRSVVDIYLSPDVAVSLLISNMGHSSQSSLITARAEPISGPPLYRPVPLDSDLFATIGATFHKRRESLAPHQSMHFAASDDASNSAGVSSPQLHGFDIGLNNSVPYERSRAEVPAPQSGRDFWLHVTTEPLEDSRGYQQVHGRLAVARQTIQVYVDSSLHRAGGWPPTVQTLAEEIAERLESSVLPAIDARVGKVADVDDDGRLAVLITPWLSRLRGGATQVRGFVRSSDFCNDIAFPFSNRADVLYLNTDLPSGTALQTLLLHEVTHAALFSRGRISRVADRSAIQRPEGKSLHDRAPHVPSAQSGQFEWDDWLNEGLAHLSERSGGGDWSNLDYRVARFWQQPAGSPLIVGDYYRSERWRDHGCRGATFLFLNWCEQQYASRNQSAFTTAVANAELPGVGAIEKVLGNSFDELYRAWSVSVARQGASSNPVRIGRFGASGPRWLNWNVTRSSQHTLNITGTATQFVELRSSRPQWYRLSFDGDPRQPWQVTLVNSPATRPAFELRARWEDGDTAAQSSVAVSMTTPLPSEWQIDRVTCEEIREPHPRVWEWSADDMRRAGTTTPRSLQQVAVLPLDNLGINSDAAVIKVRLRKSTGEIVWAWCDFPQGSSRGKQPKRIAAGLSP